LICKSLGQGAPEQVGATGKVRVVPEFLTRHGAVQQVVNVVTPLGSIKPGSSVLATFQPTGLVLGVFADEVDVTSIGGGPDLLGQILQHVLGAGIVDRMDC